MTTLDALAAARGNDYGPLEEALDATDTGLIDSDVFATHLESLPTPIDYGIQNRITLLAPWPPVGEGE